MYRIYLNLQIFSRCFFVVTTLCFLCSGCAGKYIAWPLDQSEPMPGVSPQSKPSPQLSVKKLEDGLYAFSGGYVKVWNAVVDVLLLNYNLNIVNRTEGVATTEWDNFVLEEQRYRNKISIRVTQQSWNQTVVRFVNNVQKVGNRSSDFVEGPKAFSEKRPPNWKGL